jgi:hypothetical protein
LGPVSANSRGWKRKYLLLTIVLLASCLAVAVSAWAGQSGPSGAYSTGSSDCHGGKVDPVGLVYWGSAARFDRVVRDIAHHTDIDHSAGSGGTDQRVWVKQGGEFGYSCEGYVAQVANHWGAPSPTAFFARHHVRLWDVHRGDKPNWTVGTPHHEYRFAKVHCHDFTCHPHTCHAVDPGTKENQTDGPSGFDRTRRYILTSVQDSGRHPASNAYWGNTASRVHCNGQAAGSNGNVAFIRIGRP